MGQRARQQQEHQPHQQQPRSVNAESRDTITDISHDHFGHRLALSSTDHTIQIWDLGSDGIYQLTSKFRSDSGGVRKLTWAHPDFGQLLATCSLDGTAIIWEEVHDATVDTKRSSNQTSHWAKRTTLVDSRSPITDIRFLPQHLGLMIVTCAADGHVRIYEAPDITNLSRWSLKDEFKCEVGNSSVAWKHSRIHGRVLAAGSDNPSSKKLIYQYTKLFLSALIIVALAYCIIQQKSNAQATVEEENQIDFSQIDELNDKYPHLLSSKKSRIIKARLAVMPKEVSILMLLGKSRDNHCKVDPTFCIGKTIANVTRARYEYLDASNPHLSSSKIEQVIGGVLNGNKNTVLIDSLEQLPGTHVMNLFQFIDRDETRQRRGMLLFVMYTGSEQSNQKDAEIVENVLNEKWSPFIPKDSLTSVISRISGSVVKVF